MTLRVDVPLMEESCRAMTSGYRGIYTLKAMHPAALPRKVRLDNTNTKNTRDMLLQSLNIMTKPHDTGHWYEVGPLCI